jgi:hypothetical protein
MKIAIPSHKRIKGLKTRTYDLLMRHGFDENDIYIFVSPECYNEYKEEFKNVILSKNNILDTRNHIIEYFDEGEEIVEMDDDVLDIKTCEKYIKPESVNDLKLIFKESFEKSKGGLWGFNSVIRNDNANVPVDNSDKIGIQKVSIVNSCIGYTNRKDIKLSVSEKEDFERVLIYFHKKIPILKRRMYGIHTRYWTYAGGLQDRYNTEERKKVQEISANKLIEMYPEDCKKVYRKKNNICDLRFIT